MKGRGEQRRGDGARAKFRDCVKVWSSATLLKRRLNPTEVDLCEPKDALCAVCVAEAFMCRNRSVTLGQWRHIRADRPCAGKWLSASEVSRQSLQSWRQFVANFASIDEHRT